MVEREPIESASIGQDNDGTIAWEDVRVALAAVHGPEELMFFATVRPNGRPHVTGVGASWIDGDFYITTGPQTVKAANLAGNPHCTLAGRLGGFDVSLDGLAERVVDRATLEWLVSWFAAEGWPATVAGDTLHAPINDQSPHVRPWNVYRVRANKVIAVGAGGATMRFRFAD
jgi:hypothetical protein